jgi:deoxycytidylate deaminase
MSKYLKLATKLAMEYDFDPTMEYFHCAVIVRGGNVVSIGFNKRATNSFVEYCADMARHTGRDYCMSTHAELDAICKVRAKTDLRGGKIYVVRRKPSGGVGMSRPCPICQYALRSYGLKKAFYSINDNEYGVLNLTNNTDLVF